MVSTNQHEMRRRNKTVYKTVNIYLLDFSIGKNLHYFNPFIWFIIGSSKYTFCQKTNQSFTWFSLATWLYSFSITLTQ